MIVFAIRNRRTGLWYAGPARHQATLWRRECRDAELFPTRIEAAAVLETVRHLRRELDIEKLVVREPRGAHR